jgi:DTW domain-containing protein YfiP
MFKPRGLCTTCLQPEFGCYCAHIQKFDPQIKFVILIHPIELKRRIATGRMSHLCLKNSELIAGQDYSDHPRINELLKDFRYQPLVLYPGMNSQNLTLLEDKAAVLDREKTPLIFVVDGTWATARKQMRLSENLKTLPRICFTPPGPSQFRVRKQPKAECYSTIEAVHHCIELLGPAAGFDLATAAHENLLFVFEKMVERQLEFMREAYDNPRSTSYRRPKSRVA